MQVISVELNIHNILRSPSVSPAGHFTVSSKDAWTLFINGEITEEVLLLEKWTVADIARKQREAIEQNELFYWSEPSWTHRLVNKLMFFNNSVCTAFVAVEGHNKSAIRERFEQWPAFLGCIYVFFKGSASLQEAG